MIIEKWRVFSVERATDDRKRMNHSDINFIAALNVESTKLMILEPHWHIIATRIGN